MIDNPKECWRYAIQTKHLREPPQSFQALQLLIENPTMSYVQISEQLQIEDIQQLYNWSIKYFYKERLRAYQKEMTEAIFTAKVNHNKIIIEGATTRAPKEETQLNNDLYRVSKKQQEILKLEVNDQPVPEELEKEYRTKSKEYYDKNLQHLRGAKLIDDIATMPTILTDEEIEELGTGVQEFLKAMEGNRK